MYRHIGYKNIIVQGFFQKSESGLSATLEGSLFLSFNYRASFTNFKLAAQKVRSLLRLRFLPIIFIFCSLRLDCITPQNFRSSMSLVWGFQSRSRHIFIKNAIEVYHVPFLSLRSKNFPFFYFRGFCANFNSLHLSHLAKILIQIHV
jgi:hypothetical protein